MATNKSRYRPAFSKEEVEALDRILKVAYIDDLLKPPYHPDHPLDTARSFPPAIDVVHHQLMAKISTLVSKIANNALQPAYTILKHSDPKIAMMETLGAHADEVAKLDGTETKEQYWERCYLKYLEDPMSCTVSEVEAFQEYRYLHDLMSSEEAKEFEAKATVKGIFHG